MVVHEIITAHFGGHIEPLSKPCRTTLEIPGNCAAAATTAVVVVVDIMLSESMIYNDHFY